MALLKAYPWKDGSGGDDYLRDHEYYDKDTLVGGAGNDHLYDVTNSMLMGGAGNDTLGTEYGDSTLIGGTGNDTYKLERNASTATNIIIEDLDAGVDTVEAIFSYTLGDSLENLILDNYYVGDISGIGNTLDNTIYVPGNASNDYLFGDAGNDNLNGGTGNDTVDGGTGNDRLAAGQGNHTLTGGAGADIFDFYVVLENTIGTVTDFTCQEGDKIEVTASWFGIGQNDHHRFNFNSSTGALSFDQMQFASLEAGTDFVASRDITIV